MRPNDSIDVASLASLQQQCVARWHDQPIDNPVEAESSLAWHVCQQHQFNFRLWHEEDLARAPHADDGQIARVKRSIDRLNQQRNDWIEILDDHIAAILHEAGVRTTDDTPINTETAGSAIDRLSIMALRIYHYQDEVDRRGDDDDDRASLIGRIELAHSQRAELIQSLQQLVDDLLSGRKRHRTVHQLKMYNDPRLNPAIYRQPTGHDEAGTSTKDRKIIRRRMS